MATKPVTPQQPIRPPEDIPPVLIITGLSGSGKSTVLRALEDVGYFCVDNLPLDLLPPFLAMQNGASREGRRIALGMDVRTQGFLQNYARVFRHLEREGFKLHLIFLEADEESLIRRFSQTRRQHPLADRDSISQALRQEITAMAGLRGLAHRIIDTSFYNVHQLRELIKDEYSGLAPSQRMWLHLISFAYKNGIYSKPISCSYDCSEIPGIGDSSRNPRRCDGRRGERQRDAGVGQDEEIDRNP